MKISFTKEVIREITIIKLKNPKIYLKIQKQIYLLKDNPKHPSLRLHKLKGNLTNAWSITIENNYRLLFYFQEEVIVIFLIGSHDKAYKK